jgi:Acyl-CoA dehydrogenase, C-terminal domain
VCQLFIFMGKTDPDNPDRHGFEIARGRLRPGRVHHCMRAIGQAEVAPEDVTKIAMIKVAAPNMLCRVLDFAIQAYGGAGVTEDFGLAEVYASARVLRIVDGPDEVHRNQVAKLELRKHHAPAASGSAAAHGCRLKARPPRCPQNRGSRDGRRICRLGDPRTTRAGSAANPQHVRRI